MGEGPHFAQVSEGYRLKHKNIVGSKGIMPLAESGAAPRLSNNLLAKPIRTARTAFAEWQYAARLFLTCHETIDRIFPECCNFTGMLWTKGRNDAGSSP